MGKPTPEQPTLSERERAVCRKLLRKELEHRDFYHLLQKALGYVDTAWPHALGAVIELCGVPEAIHEHFEIRFDKDFVDSSPDGEASPGATDTDLDEYIDWVLADGPWDPDIAIDYEALGFRTITMRQALSGDLAD